MSQIAAEMKNAITVLGGDRSWTDTRQRWLERAARRAGISYRTAYAFFYEQGGDPRSSSVEKVRRAVATITNEAAVSDKYIELTTRIATLEAALRAYQDRDGVGAAVDGR